MEGRTPRNFLVALVCDGMGGMANGSEAAVLAGSAFLASLILDRSRPPPARMKRAVWSANKAVHDRLKGNGGTTLTAVCIESRQVVLAHVGDSRAYIRTSGREVSQISQDDTLGGILKQDRQGEDSEDGRGLLQYVGMGEDLSPHIEPVIVERGDLLLLTSDGAHSLERRTFREICREAATHSDLTRRLLLVAEAVGAHDNATALTLDPHRLGSFAQPYGGTSVSVWTPSAQIELWLHREAAAAAAAAAAPAVDAPRVHRSPPAAPSPARKGVKGRNAKRATAKAVIPPSSSEDTSEDKPTAPQLHIQFQPDEPAPDETP